MHNDKLVKDGSNQPDLQVITGVQFVKFRCCRQEWYGNFKIQIIIVLADDNHQYFQPQGSFTALEGNPGKSTQALYSVFPPVDQGFYPGQCCLQIINFFISGLRACMRQDVK